MTSFSLPLSSVFKIVFPSLFSLRHTFGWKSLVVNMLLYLLFVLPLTAVAISTRANEKSLCGLNETMPRKVTVLAGFFNSHFGFLAYGYRFKTAFDNSETEFLRSFL